MFTKSLGFLFLICASVGLCMMPTLGFAQDDKNASDADVTRLKASIDAVLKNPKLGSTRVGVHAVDVRTGQELYARDADGLYNPASNMKLVTSACALDVFGPWHVFETRIVAQSIQGSSIKGALYVVGGGESLLLYRHVLEWAATLRNKGIKTIAGDVVIDDSVFKGGAYLPPGFEQKNESGSYRSPVGALTIRLNEVRVRVTPGAKVDDAPHVQVHPPGSLIKVVNTAVTQSGTASRLKVESQEQNGVTLISVQGNIGDKAATFFAHRRIDHPALHAGAIFAHALKLVGVRVQGKVRTGKALAQGGVTILTHSSEPLSFTLAAMNKWSKNFIAEQTLRALSLSSQAKGAHGTWEGGKSVLRACLERAGVHANEVSVLNGSGLYTGNKVSPRHLTTLLVFMAKHQAAPEFRASLAVAGRDGTLLRRFKKTAAEGNLRAKTGTLNQVTALSGYVTSVSGRDIAFSIILNDTPRRSWRYRAIQDAVAKALADFNT